MSFTRSRPPSWLESVHGRRATHASSKPVSPRTLTFARGFPTTMFLIDLRVSTESGKLSESDEMDTNSSFATVIPGRREGRSGSMTVQNALVRSVKCERQARPGLRWRRDNRTAAARLSSSSRRAGPRHDPVHSPYDPVLVARASARLDGSTRRPDGQ